MMSRDRRRRIMNRAMEVLATVAALVAVAVLVVVVISVARRGAEGLMEADINLATAKPKLLVGPHDPSHRQKGARWRS